jgi:hypothetical protein
MAPFFTTGVFKVSQKYHVSKENQESISVKKANDDRVRASIQGAQGYYP